MGGVLGDWLAASRYVVWGAGKSGRAAANLLARRGKEVVLSDRASRDDLGGLTDLERAVEFHGGGNVFADAEVVILSPGLPPTLSLFDEARERSIPVVSEVELAFAITESPWIGITGTDGKTTTTSLTGAILEAAKIPCVVAGNIGVALCDVVEELSPDTVVVAELSANQLWSCHRLKTVAAGITNLAPDHLKYFGGFEPYEAAKRRLFTMQGADGLAVIPAVARELLPDEWPGSQEHVIYYGAEGDDVGGLERVVRFDEEGRGQVLEGGRWTTFFEAHRTFPLLGSHNRRNAAMAAALAHAVGASWEDAARGISEFAPLEHRMEPVGEVDGVRFVNDSKATNPHASMAGLKGVDAPVVVIAGGLDKGLDLTDWVELVAVRAETVVVIGEIADKLQRLFGERGIPVVSGSTLEEAVALAFERAPEGASVVLSPACSSYDMFSSYVERGEVFRRAVKDLQSTSRITKT